MKTPIANIIKSKKEISSKQIDKTPDQKFRIVGVGASAGGLNAIEQFLSIIPENCGMAFVIIQHLDPTHVGILPELLQRTTKMPVIQAVENMEVEINSVYVIPSNTSMLIKEGYLHLSLPIESRGLRLTIDFFFQSLANDQKSLSIGVILSGLGSDGSKGAYEIKKQHGIIMVQDPVTAAFNSMPLMTIDAVVADIIAPANELFEKMIELLSTLPILKTPCNLDEIDDVSFAKIIILLRKRTGNDFSVYKKHTVLRRVERRMSIYKIDSISEYVKYMQNNPNEIDIFFKELIIGVTSFFRDQIVWDKLKETIIPDMLNKFNQGEVIRAWVAGCSTGEEAYSMAIVFKEAFEKHKSNQNFKLQIFATDIDNEAIQIARNGVFPSNISEHVSPYRLKKYFKKNKDGYKINAEIREMIVFAQHNLVMHSPFTNIDIVSCRNLLIYIDSALQKKIIRLFNYSIKPNGLLLLGSAETIGQNNDFFSPIDLKLKLYKRSSSEFSTDLVNFPVKIASNRYDDVESEILTDSDLSIESLANQFILENYAPAGLLVDENGDIVYIKGVISKYLQPTFGKASMNIFSMLTDGLLEPFQAAFNKVLSEKTKLILHNIKIGKNNLDVNIQYLEKPEILNGYVMITFFELDDISKANLLAPPHKKISKYLKHLKLKKPLDATESTDVLNVRDLLLRNQKKDTDNEQLRAINEVLQATNEDLTASREEMQSLNEELQIVNTELIIKASDYNKVSNDMKNLLNSTDIRILILDSKMNIRRYTTQVTNIFKIIKTDIGRPLTDLVSTLIYPDFISDAQEVLKTLIFSEKQVQSKDDRWYNVRIMPYSTLDDKIDGLIITFIDISDLKISESIISEIKNSLEIVSNMSQNAIVRLSADCKIVSFNPQAEKIFDKTYDDVLHQDFIKLFIPETEQELTKTAFSQLNNKQNENSIELKIQMGTEKSKFILFFVHKIYDSKQKTTGFIIITNNNNQDGK
ncbi:MAG: chemotaxis protein CheB [Bacteroidales bacterium]|nr:chemotaxis protein CheB [Bacteroidales bacterium]